MESFYLTLPSNASLQVYPNNTTTSFTTKLSDYINLKGEGWEMALSEVHYPNTFLTISKANADIIVEERIKDDEEGKTAVGRVSHSEGEGGQTAELAEAVDTTPDKARSNTLEIGRRRQKRRASPLRKITYSLSNAYIRNEEDFVNSINYLLKGKIKLLMNKEFKNVILTREDDNITRFLFNPRLSLQLGFLPERWIHEKMSRSLHPVNIANGIPRTMFIYCDLIKPQYVGDTTVPLLRIVNINNNMLQNFGSGSVSTFTLPHYVPISKKSFETIEIAVKDETGSSLPFMFGTLTVKLHFRQRQHV